METENSYYLVMELCGGGDLMSRICSRKRLDELETRRYIRQIVSAVDYLHKAGIIHRSVSLSVRVHLSVSVSRHDRVFPVDQNVLFADFLL